MTITKLNQTQPNVPDWEFIKTVDRTGKSSYTVTISDPEYDRIRVIPEKGDMTSLRINNVDGSGLSYSFLEEGGGTSVSNDRIELKVGIKKYSFFDFAAQSALNDVAISFHTVGVDELAVSSGKSRATTPPLDQFRVFDTASPFRANIYGLKL